MKSENITEKGRKLYFQYGQSRFHMGREGVLNIYEQCNISKEQEDFWTIEFLEKKLNELNINNKSEYFELLYIIKTKHKFSFLNKLNKVIKNQINDNNNPYSLIDLGRNLFNLIFESVRLELNIPYEIRLNTIETISLLLSKSKVIGFTKQFKASDYIDTSESLTDEQYYKRMLIDLEYDLIKAKILK